VESTVSKLDLKKQLRHLYQASAKEAAMVEVPPMTYLMVDGQGDPNTVPAYAEAVELLFTVSYAVKFMVKKAPSGVDYGVLPLEGLWWADDMARFSTSDRSAWLWTMMIAQPPFVSRDLIEQAMVEVRLKKHPKAMERLRVETFTEGRCAQILHVGPFSEEGPTVQKLHQFVDARGQRTGKHHEIYLSDIRRADPSRWKTIIRQPFR
jgi:hypothetical protein